MSNCGTQSSLTSLPMLTTRLPSLSLYHIFFRRMCLLCVLLLPTNTKASELFKSLNDYISGKLNWSFCVGICTDGVAAVTGWLSGFTTSECESTHGVIHREMLASWKMSPELHSVLQDVIKTVNHVKVHALTHVCLHSSKRRWTHTSLIHSSEMAF